MVPVVCSLRIRTRDPLLTVGISMLVFERAKMSAKASLDWASDAESAISRLLGGVHEHRFSAAALAGGGGR